MPRHSFPVRKDASLRRDLLAWYDANKRDLPWRRTKDPYRIWVSEIMLQQTRVETVIPYYERFLKQFPTLKSLAAANEDAVLALWSGLGYYRRARLLHKGVREAAEKYNGRVPEDAAERLALPGIGKYTAGAIGSIAFDRQEPLVDGNVARVLSRLDGMADPVGSKTSEAKLWSRAHALVKGERPGDFNQALMELGATVCTPRSPKCSACPWRKDCVAYKQGEPEKYPTPRDKKESPHVSLVALLMVNQLDQMYFERGNKALFGGLWSLPTQEGESIAAARELLKSRASKAELQSEALGTVTHVLTHRRLSITLYRARVKQASVSEDAKFVALDARDSLARSSLTEKLIALAFPAQLALPLRRSAAIQKKSAKPKLKSPKTRTKKSASAPGRGSAS